MIYQYEGKAGGTIRKEKVTWDPFVFGRAALMDSWNEYRIRKIK
jgi:hypothetical protein